MIQEKITTIEQRGLFRGYQSFEIRPDGDMEVIIKRFSAHNQFKLPLWQLNPNPTRLKFRQPGSIFGALNDAEFERAKSKILEQAEQRKIGFI